MSLPDVLHILSQSSLFRGTDLQAAQRLLAQCRTLCLQEGRVLLEPGTTNESAYLVLSGELRIYLAGRSMPLNDPLGQGAVAGEISAIDGKGASGLVLASTDTELLEIPNTVLWALVDQCHGFARNLLHIVSARMRNDNFNLIQSQNRSSELERAASIDAVTGVANRRWMAEAFPRVLDRCERAGDELCLVMADIDHFKRFNDTYGHLVGDRVLHAVGDCIGRSLRAEDLLARYGGEEFAVLLPRCDIDEAILIAERIRTSIEALALDCGASAQALQITLSCGVARRIAGSSLENLIEAADQALYQAKAGGRNRVEVAAIDERKSGAGP